MQASSRVGPFRLAPHAGETGDHQVQTQEAEEEGHHQADPGKRQLLPEATQGTVTEVGQAVEDDKEQAAPAEPGSPPLRLGGMSRELDADGADQDDELVTPTPGIGNHLALGEGAAKEVGDLAQDGKVRGQGNPALELQNPGFAGLNLQGVAPQPAEAHGESTQQVPQRPDVVEITTDGGTPGGGRGRGAVAVRGGCTRVHDQVRGASGIGDGTFAFAYGHARSFLCVAFAGQVRYSGPASPIACKGVEVTGGLYSRFLPSRWKLGVGYKGLFLHG